MIPTYPVRSRGKMKKYKYLLTHALVITLLIAFVLSVPSISVADVRGGGGENFLKIGNDFFEAGSLENAVQNFKKAAFLLANEGKPAMQTDSLVKLAATYRRLGLDEYALHTLEEALPLARKMNNDNITADILNSLGLLIAQDVTALTPVPSSDASIVRGAKIRSAKITRIDLAVLYLTEAHDLAKTASNTTLQASVLNNKGIMFAGRNSLDDAMSSFKESISLAERSGNKDMTAAASVNCARVAIKLGDHSRARIYVDTAYENYRGLTSADKKASGLIVVGQIYRQLAGLASEKIASYRQQATDSFIEAVAIAKKANDYRNVSYALGYLGKVNEEQKDLDKALHFSRRALFAAQQLNSKELLSSWQWQIGRILVLKGDIEKALDAYRQAVSSLQSVKQTIYSGCSSSSLSYRNDIEPVYKEFTDLLLQKSSEAKDQKEAERYLLEARDTIETLKVTEMHDYFKNSCFEDRHTKSKSIETLSDNTAIIYIISFPERIELLVSLPNGTKRVTVPNPGNAVSNDVRAFRTSLTNLSNQYMVYSKRLYDNLIRPLEHELQRYKIQTLVVIPDDVFRTIPFAALHDGTDFLINKYAFATSLGMQLIEPLPRKDKKVTMLTAGISESVQNYPSLPSVIFEMSSIKSLFGGEMLLNSDFSIGNIKAKIDHNKYSILHIASHGEFSGDVNNSFLVAWDGRLTIDQFGRLIKATRFKDEPVDLITLSACKTAVGDDRAVLGLAGVAIKSGALSSLATLWEVDDQATSDLVVDFYRQLKTGLLSKAQALQKAQISTAKLQKHPYYWSPFLLIGNWL